MNLIQTIVDKLMRVQLAIKVNPVLTQLDKFKGGQKCMNFVSNEDQHSTLLELELDFLEFFVQVITNQTRHSVFPVHHAIQTHSTIAMLSMHVVSFQTDHMKISVLKRGLILWSVFCVFGLLLFVRPWLAGF